MIRISTAAIERMSSFDSITSHAFQVCPRRCDFPSRLNSATRAGPRQEPTHARRCQMRTRLSRSALPTTDTELRLIAAAAMTGESRMPKNGYSTPAAIGTPSAL